MDSANTQVMNTPLIRILTPEDEPALKAFLAPRLASSIFLASNMELAGLDDGGERYHGTYAAAFDGNEIIGVTAHYWNGMLILQAPDYLSEIARFAVLQSSRDLTGLIGLENQVRQAKTTFQLEKASYKIDEQDGLYELVLEDLVIPETLRTGKAAGRRVIAEDLDTVSAWRAAYSVELLGEVNNQDLKETSRKEMAEKVRTGQSWVLEVNGELAANTSFNAAVSKMVQIGGVYTPPGLRGRGYGRAVVAVSLLDAREDGVERAILFTGDANIPARKAYAALGFRRIGDYRLSILQESISL